MSLQKRIAAVGAVALGLGLIAARPAAAQTYDAAADFSVTSNANGVWSYGTEALGSLGTNFTLFTTQTDSTSNPVQGTPIKGWSVPGGGLPYVIQNTSSSPQTIPTTAITLAPGQMNMHPGPAGDYSIIRFTAPTAGAYSLTSVFTGIDNGAGTTTDVHVLDNGLSLFSGEVTGNGATQSFSLASLTLAAGDTLDFAVGYGTDGSYGSDSTSPSITIKALGTGAAAAPEPGSIALAACGALPLLGMVVKRSARRKRGATA